MKLVKILDQLNSFEKNPFLKIIDSLITNSPGNAAKIESVLSDKTKELKAIDSINITKVFDLVEEEFVDHIRGEFSSSTTQLDILADILVRDGNCIMKLEWLSRLYESDLAKIEKRIKEFHSALESDSAGIEFNRKRDYLIYKECLKTAYFNDRLNNQEEKITFDELSILQTLAKRLELSQEEIKLINYSIIPLGKLDINYLVGELRNLGVVFYTKKNNTVYVPDEIVMILRKIRGKEIADKFVRRVLRLLREPQINMVCKKHNIDWRLPSETKVKNIIAEGISVRDILINEIYKEDVKISDRKKNLNDFCDRLLKISPPLRGSTLDEKVDNLERYFESIEQDDKVGISIEGYEKLVRELEEFFAEMDEIIKEKFELQEDKAFSVDKLLDYNIKPRDILELLNEKQLESFAGSKAIKTRGGIVVNILEFYKDAENLYLENYENIGYRNFNALKENLIPLREAELGTKFEEITKSIFTQLGFDVDEDLRKQLSTKSDKIDIILSLGNKELIIVECKTVKETGYNRFSSVSRQLKAYSNLAVINQYKVVKSLLVAPEFSDEFISECGLEYELNLSLLKAGSLKRILDGFRESKLKQFPYRLLFKDVLIQEERVLKAIDK